MEEERKKGSGSNENWNSEEIKITVKFGGRTIPISIGLESTVKDLKSLLQPLTNVLPRGQKLISKGKLLVDHMTLMESEVINGARIMLMASQGLHQGDGPILKEAKTRPIIRSTAIDKAAMNERIDASVAKHPVERWKTTGVVALADRDLTAIPSEVWSCGPSIRVLDVSGNSIEDLPTQIGCLSSLQKLNTNGNRMGDKCIQWEELTSLHQLTVLSINQNCLTTLPAELGRLRLLRQLDVSDNSLSSLPVDIGSLVRLEVLKANKNRITLIPTSIEACKSLVEVDLSSNFLTELPETFSSLTNLKVLSVRNNGLKSLPSKLFKMCQQLSTLDLHNTEITIDVLRQYEDWEEFDERRRLKHQKQLDFRVVGSTDFDEGADKNQ